MRGGLKKIRGRCFCFVGFRELSNWINRLILKLFFERFRHFKKFGDVIRDDNLSKKKIGDYCVYGKYKSKRGSGFCSTIRVLESRKALNKFYIDKYGKLVSRMIERIY